MQYRTFKSCPKQSTYIQLSYAMVPKMCKKPKNCKKFSHLFVSLFYHFLPLFHHKICSNLCLNWWVWLAGQYFKNTVWTLSYPNIKNTTEISHIFFHQYKFPTHDKVKLCIVIICKNYSVIHVILNENESFWHNCLLKVRNLVKFLNNLQHLCFWTNEYKRPY